MSYDVMEYPNTTAGVRTVVVPKDYEWLYCKIKELNSSCVFLVDDEGNRIHTNSIRKWQKKL